MQGRVATDGSSPRRHDTSIRVGGDAGQGGAECALLLARALARSGRQVLLTHDAPAQVRGGHTFQTVRARADGAVPHAPRRDQDILVALSVETVTTHLRQLAPGAVVLCDDTLSVEEAPLRAHGATVQRMPLLALAAQAGDPTLAPLAAAGAVLALLGLPRTAVDAALEGHGGVATRHRGAALAQRAYGLMRERTDDPCDAPVEVESGALLPNGNEALAFGALAAGCRFVGAYPMTPATSIVEWLSALDPSFGVVITHAEDEIAAVTMAAGAAYTGARALTATSGGGLALMAEAIGFAAMVEIPLVVVNAMRPGPSTGMPTRTEQGDLLFAVHLAQGEFPHIVLAPGDVAQCFEQAWRAFNLAERYQCPVLLLTDAHLATLRSTVPRTALDPASVVVDRGVVRGGAGAVALDEPFERYSLTRDGVSPRSWPGDPRGVHTVSSYEHNAAGHIEESAANRVALVDKRADKLHAAREALDGPLRYGPDEADVTLVCWGSTVMACREAVELGRAQGHSLNVLQFVDLWPFPAEAAIEALGSARRLLLVEQNATGQFGALLRAETGLHLPGRLLKYDGRALGPEAILERGLALAAPLR